MKLYSLLHAKEKPRGLTLKNRVPFDSTINI